jgi:hypothetical protein
MSTAHSIRELKHRYQLNRALGGTLPTYDLAIPLPLSTGNPLFDAALVDKLTPTTTLNEAEHTARAWHLVQRASAAELQALAEHRDGLLNDYKLLLALRAWQDGDDALTRTFVNALPWGWRLGFPVAVIKPSAQVFTGWRKSLAFRFVTDPRFNALRAFFRELLARAPGTALMKYRSTVQASLALLHYKPDGAREIAIHDLCFNNGRGGQGTPDLEPIGAFLRARAALGRGGPNAMLSALEDSAQEIPITSYMGLLGNTSVRLSDAAGEPFRRYALRSATAVEALLRLKEWSPWLSQADADAIGEKVRTRVIDAGFDIPLFKIVKAFMNAPQPTQRMVIEPLLLPLLRHAGKQFAELIEAPRDLTFFMPGSVIHLTSFLLYAVLSSAMPASLRLVFNDGVEDFAPIPLEEVAQQLATPQAEFEAWLLTRFDGSAAQHSYTYNFDKIAAAIRKLDPAAPLMLDLPFTDDMALLAAILPFQRVFNLNNPYGAPGELSLTYSYYQQFGITTRGWNYALWTRQSDSAAQKFAELMDRLKHFRALAQAADALTAGQNGGAA